MSEYDDIRTLSKSCMWPNKLEPDWAVMFAKRYDVDSTHIVVQLAGAMQEIERLREEVERLRTELFEKIEELEKLRELLRWSGRMLALRAEGGNDE